MDNAAATVDVTYFQVGGFGDPESRIEQEGKEDPVPGIPYGSQDPEHFVHAQDNGQFPTWAGEGKEGNHLGSAKRSAVEEHLGCHLDPQLTRTEATPAQLVIPGPNVIGRQLIWATTEEPSHLGNGRDILRPRSIGEPSSLHVARHAVSQETHANLLGCGAGALTPP
jgi:hypothetical protein